MFAALFQFPNFPTDHDVAAIVMCCGGQLRQLGAADIRGERRGLCYFAERGNVDMLAANLKCPPSAAFEVLP